jgi:pyruvate,water dikinase
MDKKILTLTELSDDQRSLAGGKGGTLSKLYQLGYPVPDGFVIMPGAFDEDQLNDGAWHQVKHQLGVLRKGNGKVAFAVRSSAIAEDSAYASFAGEFETVLDVHSDDAIRAAIHQVHLSRKSERVQAYSQAKGMDGTQEIAIVVQKLVRADMSGILFTADPVTGNHSLMTGNYIYGFGEELVSGEAEPYTFTLQVPKGEYDGALDMKPYAKKLFKYARQLVKDLGCPQDIEWAIADGKLYILQSRPITTLLGYDPLKGEWNSSFTGDFAWVSSEVFPDTLTPASWSIWKNFQNMDDVLGIVPIGNICGRFYMNMSLAGAMIKMVGKDHAYLVDYVKLTTGFDLDKIVVPDVPATRWQLLRQVLPLTFTMLPKQIKLMKVHEEILADNPSWCENTRIHIGETEDKHKLADMWDEVLWPTFWNLLQLQDKSNEDYFFPYISARSELIKMMGREKAENLLSNLVGESGDLASLAQLLGLQKLAVGQISKEEYHLIAGHRPPSENEMSVPRLYEDPNWIDKRLADYHRNPIDYVELQEKKRKKFLQIWGEFADRFPKKAGKIKERLDKTIAAMETREKIRTELTRSLGVFRAWFLQAGELTGLGENIFYLQNEEVKQFLRGERVKWDDIILPRKDAYQRHIELPPLPMMISGRFDPYTWANDPIRRSDYYDAHVPMSKQVQSDLVEGYPGSSGQVEGVVRIIHSPAESDLLQKGEILVAASTNVGWTPLFPKAAAVITDIGAPLSHAAIVARELGIPAVVGTGNSTASLNTGDRVRVDGSHGTVEIIEKAAVN